MKVNKYNDFILDNEFNSIIESILIIVESEGKWLDDNTYVWNIKNDDEKSPTFTWNLRESENKKNKLKKFLSNLPKDKIKKYFYKFLESVKKLPKGIRRNVLIIYSSAFLSITSIGYLTNTNDNVVDYNIIDNNKDIITELEDIIEEDIIEVDEEKINRQSDFNKAQKLVKEIEKGYSDDRKDRGNFVNTKSGKKFIGTNHGISAPVLMEYLGRIPTVSDMKNLTYQQALEIYKKEYWSYQNLNLFKNQSVANLIYDGCVNQGIRAMKDISRAAYIENGIQLGSLENPFQEKWIKLANTLDHQSLFNSIKDGRESRYKRSKTFKTHGDGWFKRLKSIDYKDIEIDFKKLGI